MRLYGLIGFPLGHSFSQRYFSEKFVSAGITECEYCNFPLETIAQVTDVLRDHPTLCGLNVTIPYKQQIIPYLTRISGEAQAIGAVNCVRITPEGLVGYNTDAYGFRCSLLRLLGGTHPQRGLILGSGGASKAVQYVLEQLGIAVSRVSRDGKMGAYTYSDLTPEVIRQHQLIVNTTPLGTFPNIQEYPALPYKAVGSGHFLFDLVYNPAVTEFLRRGSAQGASTINGYDMLTGQAERAWEIWSHSEK